jgi:integrase
LTRVHIVPALGHIKLKNLTPLHVQQFYGTKLESGLAKRTVEYIHTVLHAALKQAVRWELVPRNVTDAVGPPRPEKKERPTFNLKQARTFLRAAREDRFEALYVLVIQTGMRIGASFSVLGGTTWTSSKGCCTSGKHWRQAASPSASPRPPRDAAEYGSHPTLSKS